MRKLTAKEDAFAKEVVLNTGDKVAALKEAGYAWKNYSKNALSVQADKIYNRPYVSLKIKELQIIKNKVAKDEFKIDAAWVLKQAVEVHQRCMASAKVFSRAGEAVVDDDGNPVYAFQHVGANKSLELIGKHISVNAFSEALKVPEDIVEKSFNDFYDED